MMRQTRNAQSSTIEYNRFVGLATQTRDRDASSRHVTQTRQVGYDSIYN